jgi:hypothetical protein
MARAHRSQSVGATECSPGLAPQPGQRRDGQPQSGGQTLVYYRSLDDVPQPLRRENVREHCESEVLWVTPHHEPYVDQYYAPDECWWISIRTTPEDQRAHEYRNLRGASRQIHDRMELLSRQLGFTGTLFRRSDSWTDVKEHVEWLTTLALDIHQRRWTEYARWSGLCSNNRGRILEIAGYHNVAMILLQLAVNFDPDEPTSAWRWCDNVWSLELVESMQFVADPWCSNLFEVSERFLENVNLWLARDRFPRGQGSTPYQLVHRGCKRPYQR